MSLYHPTGVAFADGQVYLAGGSVHTLDPGTGWLVPVAGTNARGLTGGGGLATRASFDAIGVAVDGAGNLVIPDKAHSYVLVAAATSGVFYGKSMKAGHIYAVAGVGHLGYSGDGGPATMAELNQPFGVAVDHAGNLVVADLYNNRVRVVAARTGTFYGVAMTAGDIYTVAGNGQVGYSGDGGPATSATVDNPYGVAVDANGNLVIGDSGHSRVRVVAAHTGTFYGIAMTAGDIYTVAGNGVQGYSGDGGPATSAKLGQPAVVAADGSGNLAIVDTLGNRVRMVAAHTGTFYGVAMTAGDIYAVAGNGHNGFAGDGGPATEATLYRPNGVTVDSAGNLVIADTSNGRVRVVAVRTGTFYGVAMTVGHIYTVAGGGKRFGDGGPATEARLGPAAVAVGGAGNLVIADSGNNRIRLVTG